jgi:hypothetical protein
MISTLMFDRTITVAPLERAATVLAAKADEARVLLHATVDEVVRYLYVLSLTGGETLSILSGLLIVLAVVVGLGRSRRFARSSPEPTLGASFEVDQEAA